MLKINLLVDLAKSIHESQSKPATKDLSINRSYREKVLHIWDRSSTQARKEREQEDWREFRKIGIKWWSYYHRWASLSGAAFLQSKFSSAMWSNPNDPTTYLPSLTSYEMPILENILFYPSWKPPFQSLKKKPRIYSRSNHSILPKKKFISLLDVFLTSRTSLHNLV